jgi:hypothetical protein
MVELESGTDTSIMSWIDMMMMMFGVYNRDVIDGIMLQMSFIS